MSIQKLERVLWRLRKMSDNPKYPKFIDLRRAIMYECGTHPATYITNKRALTTLGWIEKYTKARLKLTDKDLQS